MIRILLVLAALMLAPAAHAGFLLGYALGSAGNKTTIDGSPVVLSSSIPGHDVIVCSKADPFAGSSEAPAPLCEEGEWWYEAGHSWKKRTVYQYAALLGYRVVHKIGTLVVPGRTTVFYVIEVSK